MIKQQVSDAYSTFNPALLTRVILGGNIASSDETAIRAIAGRRYPPLSVVPEARIIRATQKGQR
jgi:hypothetical protein